MLTECRQWAARVLVRVSCVILSGRAVWARGHHGVHAWATHRESSNRSCSNQDGARVSVTVCVCGVLVEFLIDGRGGGSPCCLLGRSVARKRSQEATRGHTVQKTLCSRCARWLYDTPVHSALVNSRLHITLSLELCSSLCLFCLYRHTHSRRMPHLYTV